MGIALSSIAIALFFGTVLGMIAGYFGGAADSIIMRIMDMFFAFPSLLLALFIVTALGPGAGNTILAIALVYLPIFARVARAPVLTLKEREFVQAAVLIGARDSRILVRHILPNLLAPLIVTATLALSWAVLTEAGLSFLGLGTVPPNPSWGSMLSDSKTLMEFAPWTTIFPGLAILFCVLGFNFLGDGLRDVLDPRIRA
ncbi:MAG: ABC transporter permease [Anaerolineales bacterium]|jgi:peptide/nickel transport system permease protein